jgi:hypothetical protein
MIKETSKKVSTPRVYKEKVNVKLSEKVELVLLLRNYKNNPSLYGCEVHKNLCMIFDRCYKNFKNKTDLEKTYEELKEDATSVMLEKINKKVNLFDLNIADNKLNKMIFNYCMVTMSKDILAQLRTERNKKETQTKKVNKLIEVNKKEGNRLLTNYDTESTIINNMFVDKLPDIEKKIVIHLLNHTKKNDICKELNITASNLAKHIKKIQQTYLSSI